MTTPDAGSLIREARRRAGLTQAEAARRAGLTQGVWSLYERGLREPSLPMLTKTLESLGRRLEVALVSRDGQEEVGPVSAVLTERADGVRKILADAGATEPRVFGSVARRVDTEASDLDLLVRLPAGTGLFALSRLRGDLERLLGVRVDVVPEDSLRPGVREHVQREARPL